MGKVQSDTNKKVNTRRSLAAPAWDPTPHEQHVGRAIVKSKVTKYGPQHGGKNPCIIVRPGEDPAPTCVNPQCPKADNCRKHIMNRTDQRTPSIAIITWYECDHYDAIDPEKYKDKKNGKHTRKPTV
jgi:hypothetical protein